MKQSKELDRLEAYLTKKLAKDETETADYDTFVCPVTGNPCMHEHDQFCEDYGCARKAGIDVDELNW